MITDTPQLRSILGNCLEGLVIEGTPSPSGQRVVYFGYFNSTSKPISRVEWGKVVVKVSKIVGPSQIAYLEKEVSILKSITSNNYPKLFLHTTCVDFPTPTSSRPDHYFITIEERIESAPLSSATNNYTNEKAALDLLCKLVNALEPLWRHSSKLVHRDLKPANILIRPNEEVVIIDLGILREEGQAGATLSFFQHGPCTPHYASPEQAKNDKRNISFKSDFFSLGIIIYELLAKKNPFGPYNQTIEETLSKVVSHRQKSLHSLGVCSEETSNLITKLLEKEPYKRFRTIELLKSNIQQIQDKS